MKVWKMSKHITPKWVDRLLIGFLFAMPVLYAAGFNVNYGPSMSHLGWFYRTSWGEQPTRVGQIVRFAQPDQPTWRKYILPSIKRVAEIRKDGYYVEGDNTERSQDSRDWCKSVPADHVAGVVVWCWSPSRAWRNTTPMGKLRNKFEFDYATTQIGCYEIANLQDCVKVLNPTGKVVKIWGKYETHNGTFLLMRKGDVLHAIDLQSPDHPFVDLQSLLMSWVGASPPNELKIGVKRVQYGLEFTLPTHEKVFVRCIVKR